VAGILYSKQRPGRALLTLLSGHLLLSGNYIAYVAVWRALFRYLRGSRSWAKTKRVDERKPALRPVVTATLRPVVTTTLSPVPVALAASVPVREPVFTPVGESVFTPARAAVLTPARESVFTPYSARRG
jgi:hypothetical protein